MKKASKSDIILILVLVMCVLELIVYSVISGMSNNEKYNQLSDALTQYSYLFDLVNSLTSGYIMSYIFYIVVLIPENRKQQSINRYIDIYLGNLSRFLNSIVAVAVAFEQSDAKCLSASPKLESVVRSDTERYEFLTYKEHFVKFYVQFSREYYHLAHYIAFTENDLRDCLYEIVTSSFYTRIRDFLIENNAEQYDEIFSSNFDLGEFVTLVHKLENIRNTTV